MCVWGGGGVERDSRYRCGGGVKGAAGIGVCVCGGVLKGTAGIGVGGGGASKGQQV